MLPQIAFPPYRREGVRQHLRRKMIIHTLSHILALPAQLLNNFARSLRERNRSSTEIIRKLCQE